MGTHLAFLVADAEVTERAEKRVFSGSGRMTRRTSCAVTGNASRSARRAHPGNGKITKGPMPNANPTPERQTPPPPPPGAQMRMGRFVLLFGVSLAVLF